MPPPTATMATVAGGSGGRRSRSKQHVMVYKVVNSRNKEDMAAVRVLLVLTTEKDHIQIEYLPVRRKAVENRPRNSRRCKGNHEKGGCRWGYFGQQDPTGREVISLEF